nr:LysM peptidoglycan-binding domain-containing protein [Bacteroidota bacterium]
MGIKRLLLLCFFAVTTTVLSAQSVTEHVVVKGNTLYSLSKQYGITVDALLEANPQIVGTTLSLGDILIVPKSTQADTSPLTTAVPISDSIDTAHATPAFEMYKVRRGDTPAGLAKEWGFPDMASFYRINPDARSDWKRGLQLVKPMNEMAVLQATADTLVVKPASTADTAVFL